MISVCTTSKLSCYCYCYCYCVQRTVNVKKSLLRLQQKRNIEIYVYRLSLSCITQSRQTADINVRDHWLPTQRGKEDIWFSSVWRTSWECPKSPQSTPLYPPLPPCPTSFALYPLPTLPLQLQLQLHSHSEPLSAGPATSCWVRIVTGRRVCPSYCHY